eukprot:9469144-Pyramimonas_sp.AAC.1
MRCMIVPVIDLEQELYRFVFYGVVADDIQCTIIGTTRFVLEWMPKIASTLMEKLRDSHLPLSLPKLALLSSNPDVTKTIVEEVPALMNAPRDITKNLGVDCTHRPRKGLVRAVRKHRLKLSSQRAQRIAQLRKAGGRVHRLVAASVKPVAMYGTHVTGISAAHIHEVRKHYHTAMSGRPHRSITMDMALDRVVHPAVPGHTDVIVMWCACRWDRVLPDTMLDEALDWARRHVTSSTQWHDLYGPASAVVATLLRLGWT